ncbi:MAG: 3-hydroxyacyl-CoA dehydrogenase NAD-binding domain-containing protein [Acidobacteriota bacterium]|jgi:3-hydroxyacyl-CoA dehydrogenase / enoyl-CoA hydratase / 3-hydroxybutyryl-CoA epimerase
MANAWNLDLREDGIGLVTLDLSGEKINKLSAAVMEELDALLDRMRDEKDLKAAVFISGKDNIFIAGADIEEIKAVTDEENAYEVARKGQLVIDKVSHLPFPTVAAIHGACVGGGLEFVLACTHRIATDDKKTRLGLPEVKLGIIPGFGGSQRLPRLIGLQQALKIILNGSTVDGRKARKIGLAHACVPKNRLLDEALKLASKAAAGKAPRPAFKPKGMVNRILESTPFGRSVIFKKSREMVLKATGGHYPAPLAALDAVREGRGLRMDKALEVEAKKIPPLIVSATSKNLINLFFMTEDVKRQTGTAGDTAPLQIRRAGVLGAGVMGGGIAQLLAQRGVTVRLKDIKEEFLGKGLAEAQRLFNRRVKRRRMKRHEAEDAMSRISPALAYDGFRTLDFVVEAVVEKLEVKRAVLKEVQEAASESLVFATNTSSLPITQIAEGAPRPDRVVGMHFFNPVHRMPLVEVIRGKETSDEAAATVFALAKRLGKMPVVCQDGPGFLVNRLLMPYLNEAAYLLEEGVPMEVLDSVMTGFGMPMGPVRLMDEVGLDTAYHVGQFLSSCFPDRMPPAPLMEKVFQEGMLGKKSGIGFYFYFDGKQGPGNPDAIKLLPGEPPGINADTLVERMVLPMINEASRILEEKIVETPQDVDLGMIMGTGFPPFRGGLLRYADSLGAGHVADRLKALAEEAGPRFAPSPSLVEMASRGKRFFGEGD